MLVIGRRVDQKIYFLLPNGGQIELTMVEARAGFARIGISCPRDITISREEILDEKREEHAARKSTTTNNYNQATPKREGG